ncbi:hypothetical protein CAEBREN_24550 [Caenorhabditis brenneri]|uniref:Uncharacterized protein n=1 Tax=Caenorhabditis brenneri TaxID=135651 RepID=G0PFP0_CAEBE|nr:hypothetical protein CAEBREN_24550 [Caenorhabditis brenneri]
MQGSPGESRTGQTSLSHLRTRSRTTWMPEQRQYVLYQRCPVQQGKRDPDPPIRVLHSKKDLN